MPGVAIITESCIDTKDRACVDVCPVQCIYEFDAANNVLLPARCLPGGGDLLRGASAGRIAERQVQREPTRTRATTTRSSPSSAATSSPTEIGI